jgi:uncharacterized membrane protein (UPF0127 family)
MKVKYFLIIALLLIVSSGCVQQAAGNQVCIRDRCFEVELAVTPEERAQGLMGRNKLDADKGMLFIFEEEGNHSFWMKDTMIPLDIIWINSGMEIVFISGYTQPCELLKSCPSVTPPEKARYVLEVGAGEAYDFEAGDTVTFSGDF